MDLINLPDWATGFLTNTLTAIVVWLTTRKKKQRDEVLEQAKAITEQWQNINTELDRRMEKCNDEIKALREKLTVMINRVDELETINRQLSRQLIDHNLKRNETPTPE